MKGMKRSAQFYLDGLSPEQKAVVLHGEGPAAVFAGPGSGKTKTLISRLLHLVVHQGVNPDQIVVTTFTQKAARELRERIDLIVRTDESLHRRMTDLSIGTIHSYCLKILAQFGYMSGASCTNLVNLEDNDILLLLSVHSRELGLSYQEYREFLEKMGGISRSRRDQRTITHQGFLSEIASHFSLLSEGLLSDSDLEKISNENFESSYIIDRYKKYRQLMQDLGVLDHSLILQRTFELLDQAPLALRKVQDAYSHFLIDEFQDTNLVQDRIFQLLAGKSENLMVVGDEDQSIYGFRGARVELFRDFSARWKGTKGVSEYLLEGNYRSGKKIVEHFNDFKMSCVGDHLIDAQVEPKKKSRPLRVETGDVFIIKAPDEELLAEAILQRVRTLKRSRSIDSYASVALLYRSDTAITAKILKNLKSVRERRFRDVEIEFSSDKRMLKNETVRVFLELLERLSDKFDPTRGDRKVAKFITEEADRVEKQIDTSGVVAWATSQQDAKKQVFIHRVVSFFLKQKPFLDVLPIGSPDFTPSNTTFYFGKLSEEAARYDRIIRRGSQKAAWAIRAFLRYLEEADQSVEAEPNLGMQVLTFHKAKGLEWPVVFLLEPDASLFSPRLPEDDFHAVKYRILNGPNWRTEALVEQQRECDRLLYVGQSRARSLLVYAMTDECAPYPALNTLLRDVPHWPPITEPLGLDQVQRKTILLETSHSDLRSHQDCGLRYQIEKILGFEGKPLPQLYEGKSLHRALQTIHEGWKAGKTFTEDDRKTVFSQSWISFGQSNAKAGKRRDYLMKLFLKYCAAPPEFFANSAIEGIEVEVLADLQTSAGTVRLEGRIDLLLRGNAVPILVDYKLNHSEDELAAADLQLAGYQLALGYDNCARLVYSLEDRQTSALPILSLAECKKSLLPRLESLTKDLTNGHFVPTSVTDVCGKCNLADFCPAYNLKKPRNKADYSIDPAA